MKKKESYYTKPAVYGDDPLFEWMWEAEDAMVYRDEEGDDATKCILKEDLSEIFDRHTNTVEEYKKRNHL